MRGSLSREVNEREGLGGIGIGSRASPCWHSISAELEGLIQESGGQHVVSNGQVGQGYILRFEWFDNIQDTHPIDGIISFRLNINKRAAAPPPLCKLRLSSSSAIDVFISCVS